MIEPSQDRLDYSALLAPPAEGFELDIAVATTYSLDLSALMAALLASSWFWRRLPRRLS